MTKSTTNARTQLLDFVVASGWKLDETETIPLPRWSNKPGESQDDRIQHPHAFVKAAAHGGVWKIKLDYRNRSSYSGGFDNILRGVEVRHIFDGSEVALFPYDWNASERSGYIHAAKLQNSDKAKYVSTSWLWNVTYGPTGSATLRQRAEMLIANPDLVIWLAAEAKHQDAVRAAERLAARRADTEARQRPMPEGWDELVKAARAVTSADGKSDPVALIAALRDGIREVENAWCAQIS